jgi:aspartate aminotransferase-like enzyme
LKIRLFTPGPVEIPTRILAALARPSMHHRTEAFRRVFKDVTERLARLFATEGVVVTLGASGSGGLEAAVVNLVAPGCKPLVVEAGKFGERWAKILKAYGVEPEVISFDWGKAVDVAQVEAALSARPAPVLFFTHSETSTGVLHDAEALAAVAHKHGALAVADVVTSVGVHDVRMDAMGLDVAVCGSQKGLMLPPGLAFVALGASAMAALDGGPRLPRFYWDLRKAVAQAKEGETPFTPPTSLVVALAESLAMIEEEGLPRVVVRHAHNAGATRAAVAALGLTVLAERPSNAVTAVGSPAGVDAGALVKAMRERHGMVIANGQDRLKGVSFRVGHMGAYDEADILAVVGALEDALGAVGQRVAPGAGVSAAQASFAAARGSAA